MRIVSRLLLLPVLLAASLTSMACDDPCGSSDAPTAELGRLAGAADFEELTDGDTVTLSSSPQGGQGIFAAARTIGLESHLFLGLLTLKRVTVDVRVIDNTAGSEDVLGDFTTVSRIQCVDGEFGVADDIVFGLDPDRFGTGFDAEPNENLVAVDGHTVTLEAVITDENESTVTVSRDVVLDAAPDAVENP